MTNPTPTTCSTGPREGAANCHACGRSLAPGGFTVATLSVRTADAITGSVWTVCRSNPECRKALADAMAQALEDAR